MSIKIIGTGSVVPKIKESNSSFINNSFYDTNGDKIKLNNEEIIQKFNSITGIKNRRYVSSNQKSSDIAIQASKIAIEDSGINKEEIDYIILAHNIGDITFDSNQVDILPSIASRVKSGLEINNPSCVAYDIIFGCPGWLEGVIQASAFIKSKIAKTCLVIGSETLSRVLDKSDRDSMIYADGAGASIIQTSNEKGGILSHKSASYTSNSENSYIYYGTSNNRNSEDTKFIKMQGRKVYEFALKNVPIAMKECLDFSKIPIEKIKKIFIHQANQKMDEAIINRFYKLYKIKTPDNILPMNIEDFGNSSVATIPTLFDLTIKKNYNNHYLKTGDHILFASVGAGMNINALTYQI